MSNPDQVCFLPEPGDTNFFASSVAINDKYLVVGDISANRIVVFQKNTQGQWYRDREIYPPENSILYQAGNGFGKNLRLDKNSLLTDASSIIRINKTAPFNIVPGSCGQYFIRLDREDEAQLIDIPSNKKDGYIQFYILSEDEPKLITLPDNNEELFRDSLTKYRNFAVHKNLLLVGSPSNYTVRKDGKGWLYNLQALNSGGIELAGSNAFIGDTVALSEQFAVVGNKKSRRFLRDHVSSPKTLIKSLKNDSTVIIDNWGRLALDKNILTVMLPSSRSHFRAVALLQIFRLDEDAIPHLIQERKYNKRAEQYLSGAWIQNDWLITIFRFGRMGRIKFCVESVEQIIKN